MVIVAIEQIAMLWPEAEIGVASYAKSERRPLGRNVATGLQGPIPFELLSNSPNLRRLIRVLGVRIFGAARSDLVLYGDPYLQWFKHADLVLDVSGFALSDRRSPIRRLAYGVELLTAWVLGRPMYLLSQAFGPLETWTSRTVARLALPLAQLVIVRDRESARYLERMGLRDGLVHRRADMAFLLSAANTHTEKCAPLGSGRPVIGIVPNVNLLTEVERRGRPGRYVGQLAALADLGDELEADVVFLCFETFSNREIDDEWIARQAARLTHAESVWIVSNRSAQELKAIVRDLDLLVGARFHSVVAAIATCTPFLAVGWAHKYAELAADVGVPEAFVDGKTIATADLLSLVRDAWRERDATRTRLQDARPDLVDSAKSAFELVQQTWIGSR